MKKFRLAPISLALMTVLCPIVVSQAAAPGDLSIYTTPNPTANYPTILLMVENSDRMDDADEPLGATIGADYDTVTDSDNISYRKYYFKNYITNGPKYYTRMSRVKDAIFYLMNTPGVLDENISIGLGSYSANSDGNDLTLSQIDAGTGGGATGGAIGDSSAGEIYIPARPIGAVGSAQRKAIKRYVASLCPGPTAKLVVQSCTGLPMAARAYADAGAYMLGTTTAKLELNPDSFQTRVFRAKDGLGNAATAVVGVAQTFQFCPDSKRQIINYGYSYYRSTCIATDWVNINKDNAASYGVEWSIPNPYLQPGGRPVGFVTAASSGEKNSKGVNLKYSIDLTNLPDDTWGWFIDYVNRNPNNVKVPPNADALGYFGTGMRNAPPAVRADGYTYQHPDYNKCSGVTQTDSAGQPVGTPPVTNGIFFITGDGGRGLNTSINNASYAGNLMNLSLLGANQTTPTNPIIPDPANAGSPNISTTGSICAKDGAIDGTYTGTNDLFTANGWNCIAQYSKRLNPPTTETPVTSNPAAIRIKTGVFQFVGADRSISDTKSINGIPAANCSLGATQEIRNACQWGSPSGAYTGVGGYGQGGYVQSTYHNADEAAANNSYIDLANAISSYTKNVSSGIGLTPTATPTIPADPITPNGLLNTGYLPLVAPTPSSQTAQWQGNLRKYNQSGNTFVDKQTPPQSPFTNTSNALLSQTSLDLWSNATTAYKSPSQAGGVYENVPTPATSATDSPRNVYISTATIAATIPDTGTPGTTLTRVKPIVDDNDVGAINKVNVANVDNQDTLRTLLLNYMGFSLPSFVSSSSTVKGTTTADISKTASNTKYMGGVNHSTPIAIVPSASYDSTAHTYTADKRYIVFGAMDNALHIVDDSTGKEAISYFPQEVLAGLGGQQYKGMTPNMTVTNGPAIGVDAPWTAYSTYTTSGSKMTADKLYLYGGARLGAQAYYGLNLTGFSVDSTSNAITNDPKQLFTITPTTKVDGKSIFTRLGYTFAKPVIAKIKWQGKPKLVAILSGGYDSDRKYDATDDKVTSPASGSSGNAIYIVDAENGQPLIVASDTGTDIGITSATNSNNAIVNNCSSTDKSCTTYNNATSTIPVLNTNLKYSIAGSVKTLDRDADDLVDAVYFSDLNGQVFRLDINNVASQTVTTTTGATTTTTSTNPAVRLVQLANLNTDTTKQGPRFYEAPVVTVHQKTDGTRFVAVSLASGDRSNPNPANPATSDTTVNYVYVVYDKDVGSTGLFNPSYTLKTSGVTIDTTNFPTNPTSTTSDFTRNGWRSPLQTANVYATASATASTASNSVTGLKAFGPLAALNNKLYVSVFNPNDGKTDTSGCTSQVVGTSEANQYCLPYGYCTTGSGTQNQRVTIGKGIQAITFANGTAAGTLGRSLVTSNAPTTTATASASANTTLTGLDSSAPSLENVWNLLGKLRPMGWFDTQLSRSTSTSTGQGTQ